MCKPFRSATIRQSKSTRAIGTTVTRRLGSTGDALLPWPGQPARSTIWCRGCQHSSSCTKSHSIAQRDAMVPSLLFRHILPACKFFRTVAHCRRPRYLRPLLGLALKVVAGWHPMEVFGLRSNTTTVKTYLSDCHTSCRIKVELLLGTSSNHIREAFTCLTLRRSSLLRTS